jgi:paraquat-inducible protein A
MVPVGPGSVASCVRCGSAIRRRTRSGLHRTAALSVAALALYVPANLLPILRMERYGIVSENTVWDASALLFEDGDYPIAVVVFAASILVPLLKLLGLFFLVFTTRLGWAGGRMGRTWVYRVIEKVGPWAMLDVFVIAVLVSLVKLQRLATVVPGPGAIAFTGVVVFTLMASASFDPQLIWEKEEDEA